MVRKKIYPSVRMRASSAEIKWKDAKRARASRVLPVRISGCLLAISQLQELDGKFHVPDRAFSQLDLTPGAPILAQLGFGLLFHGKYPAAQLFVSGAEQQRPGLLQKSPARGLTAGYRPRFEQRLFFPEAGVVLQVGQVAFHGATSGPTLPQGRRRISTR